LTWLTQQSPARRRRNKKLLNRERVRRRFAIERRGDSGKSESTDRALFKSTLVRAIRVFDDDSTDFADSRFVGPKLAVFRAENAPREAVSVSLPLSPSPCPSPSLALQKYRAFSRAEVSSLDYSPILGKELSIFEVMYRRPYSADHRNFRHRNFGGAERNVFSCVARRRCRRQRQATTTGTAPSTRREFNDWHRKGTPPSYTRYACTIACYPRAPVIT